MGRKQRERGAAAAAQATRDDVGAALLETVGEDAPPAFVAFVAAAVLWRLRVREYQRKRAAFEAARSAFERAQALLADAISDFMTAERAMVGAARLFTQAAEVHDQAADLGLFSRYVPPDQRGDAWEGPAPEEDPAAWLDEEGAIDDGHEEEDDDERRRGRAPGDVDDDDAMRALR